MVQLHFLLIQLKIKHLHHEITALTQHDPTAWLSSVESSYTNRVEASLRSAPKSTHLSLSVKTVTVAVLLSCQSIHLNFEFAQYSPLSSHRCILITESRWDWRLERTCVFF